MKKFTFQNFIFLCILIVCVSTVLPFWAFVIEHIFRGKDSVLTMIFDGIVLEHYPHMLTKKKSRKLTKDK